MLFKSTMIGTVSGSVGGSTGSHNRFGQYIRRRAIPVNPRSTFQQTVRTAFQYLTEYWKNTLTPAQRIDWTTYADNTPVINALGDTIHLTGLNMFLRTNVPTLQSTLAVIAAAPPIFGLAESDPTMTVSAVGSTDVVSVAFNNALPWANEVGGYLFLYQSRPLSPSINFITGSKRFASVVGGAVSPPTSPTTYTSPFNLSAGQKIEVRGSIRRADGRLSAPFPKVCIVS